MQQYLSLCLITPSLLLCLTGVVLGTPPYTFSPIDFPGASDTDVFRVNDAGQVVGAYVGDSGKMRGFLLDDDGGGGFTTIDFPAATELWAFGINDTGRIVGPYRDAHGAWHGFLLDEGVFTTIDFPAATRTEAKGINNNGKIVGYYEDAGAMRHGFTLDGGVFTTIDFPLAIGTRAFGINDSGGIVGEYEDAGGWHGFMLDGAGGFTTIDFPGATRTRAIGINDTGDIVGRYWAGEGWHGFLLDLLNDDGGGFITVDFPGAVWTRAIGINDDGDIVGRYWDDNKGRHGFIAAPSICADTIYDKGGSRGSYIIFNNRKGSRDKASLRLRVDRAFCDAIEEGVGGISLVLENCNQITIPGSRIKSNRGKTMFRAGSGAGERPVYKLTVSCRRGWAKVRLKRADLNGCVSNPVVKTCLSVSIKDGPCLCAAEGFEGRWDNRGRLKKLYRQ